MSARHSWKGFLQLSLVAIPVKAYPATATSTDIHLHQLHAGCNSRIRYQKICKIHGEVQDIVSAYEYAKDRYVVIDPEELDKLRSEADKAIHIDAFIKPGSLDPLYASGKSYYLVPDGPLAQKAYALLRRGMLEASCQAIAQVVMHGKERVVWLRLLGELIVMTQLSYHAQVSGPGELIDQAPQTDCLPKELELLRSLMAACTPRAFDYARYQDGYARKLTQLIEAKIAGKNIVAPPATPTPVFDLIEALQKSVEQQSGADVLAKTTAPNAAKANASRTKKSHKPADKSRFRKQTAKAAL
jgi:DNA end-binding protein Ku